MINRPSEEEWLTMVVKNLLPVYHKYLFAYYFSSFKALVVVGTQIEDAVTNGMIRPTRILDHQIPKLLKYPTYTRPICISSFPLFKHFKINCQSLEDNSMSNTCH